MLGSYVLDSVERRILGYVTENMNATPKEIARAVGTDEQTARRLYNRLFAENACSQLIVPNYALLGYKVMMIQKLRLKSTSLPDTHRLMSKIESEWRNCIDCHETFDGSIYVRSVWRNAEAFKDARARLHQKHGVDWLESEDVDMVPLSEQRGVIRVRSLWDDADDKAREG
jgi:DNA-binding Lrp family transcriptional regulator